MTYEMGPKEGPAFWGKPSRTAALICATSLSTAVSPVAASASQNCDVTRLSPPVMRKPRPCLPDIHAARGSVQSLPVWEVAAQSHL